MKQIMSQLLDNSKNDKNREKKIEKKNWQKIKKKNSKIIFGSELSEANNEATFRFLNFWHQIVIADLVPRSL